ncbi:MAG: Uma2 family endonuclease [Chloroflexota bacterium]|nr:Uma2 family endonuclease [Chloroflexota bacterium]
MSAPTKLMTYDDLLTLPDDGQRYELFDGVLIVPAAPSFYHARLVSRLFRVLDAYLSPLQLGDNLFTGPVDVRLTSLRVVQPDLLYIRPDRPEAFASPPAIKGAPDLAVEVLSSNRHHDLVVKLGYYEQAGVREYWIVDPEDETLTLYVLVDGRFVEQPRDGDVFRSVVLPGLEVHIAAMFANV